MAVSSFKSGFICITGAPNVGKSTLLNQLVGEKIAIISPKPQTTRNRILGVRTTPDSQMIFLDTPGIHRARGSLDSAMVRTALASLANADLILFLVEANAPGKMSNQHVLHVLKSMETDILLVVNKIDLVQKDALEPLVESLMGQYPFKGTICISALNGTGLDELLSRIVALLPSGPAYYPEDTLTDLPKRFLCAEIIREKIIHATSKEVPYSAAVTVSSFQEDQKKNLIHIQADIHVERSSQKAIVIGKHGSMLRTIGTEARLEIERLLGSRVFLELWVRVQKKWRKDPRALREFGYQ